MKAALELYWFAFRCLCWLRCFRLLQMVRHKLKLKYIRASVKWPCTTNCLASFSWFVLFYW